MKVMKAQREAQKLAEVAEVQECILEVVPQESVLEVLEVLPIPTQKGIREAFKAHATGVCVQELPPLDKKQVQL